MVFSSQPNAGKGVCICDKLRAEENSKASALLQRTLAQSATSSELCPHGYTYCRDNGTRCLGGTHYSPAAEAAMREAEALEGGSKLGMCSFGYPFNRENGSRCQGGSHFARKKRTVEKEAQEQATCLCAGCRRCCCHCCVHGNCPSGRRSQSCVARKKFTPPITNAECPLHPRRRYCQREVCEHGYARPKGSGKPCPTYPLGTANENMKRNGYCPCVKNTQMSDQRFEFCRNNGARCIGGTHCLSCPSGCHGNEDIKEESPHRDLCPYGFRFTRENGNRCYGGNHRRQPRSRCCPCVR